MTRTALLGSAALFAVTLAAPLAAQTAAAAADEGLEIVVTAQKRSENLQDVPVALTVVGGAQIDRLGTPSLEGAQYLVPSLNFRKSGVSINQSLYLRGVGTATFSLAGEPSVSAVLDGVVLARAGEAFSDLVDIERIEVLRGPQGTLFGKNASAGVVNIITKRPGDELGGFAEGGIFFDNGTEYRVRGGINVPIGDNVRTRLIGFYSDYDGNIINDFGGKDQRTSGNKRYGFRGVVEADISDTVKATVIADWRKADDDCCVEVPGTTPTGVAGLALAGITFAGDETRTIRQDTVNRNEEESWGVSAQFDVQLGTHSVTSITAYRDYSNNEIREGDWTGTHVAGITRIADVGPQTGKTFTQELRLTSPADFAFSYVLGAFYYHADTERTFTRNSQSCGAAPSPLALVTCGTPTAPITTNATGSATFGSTFDNVAVFGQGTWKLADSFRLIGGLRYTIDNLSINHSRVSVGLPVNAAGVPQAFGGIQPNFDQGVFNSAGPGLINGTPLASTGQEFRTQTSQDNLSGKFGAQFDVSQDVMAYATYSRGYKGPAYNVFFNLNPNGTNVIEAEIADAYEIGLKNTLFDGKLILNLAGFYAKYKNFQANNPDVVAGVVVTRFTNAGDVSTRGGELDFVFRPMTDFNINGGVAYTDAQVDAFKAPPGSAVIPAGTPLAYAPEWKASLGIDYTVRTGGFADIQLALQGSTQSSQLSIFDASALLRQQGTIGAYSIVDATVSLIGKDDAWRLSFLVKNLFDDSFAAAIANGGPGGALLYRIPREADRYFGVTARVNF